MVLWLVDYWIMSLTGCMQAGVRFLPTFSSVCRAQVVWLCFSLIPGSMWAREAGSPTNWLSYLMWSGALIMLYCYYRTFWNTPESRNLDKRGYFSDSALQSPFCSELKGHNLILSFSLLKKSINSQMLQGIHLFSYILANENKWDTKTIFLIKKKKIRGEWTMTLARSFGKKVCDWNSSERD